MIERDRYPAGVPCWVDTSHDDPVAAAAFYGGLLGWDMEDLLPPDAPGHYFMGTIGGRSVAAALGSSWEVSTQQGTPAGYPSRSIMSAPFRVWSRHDPRRGSGQFVSAIRAMMAT